MTNGRAIGVSAWWRPGGARDPDEVHRASTPLELLFDLCFVVAVSQAAGRLHVHLADGEVGQGLLGYAMVFFAIWWCWVNTTWYASAYGAEDIPYRLLIMLQICGALVLAAGVPVAFDEHDFSVVTAGYVIMRLALVALWLRAWQGDPDRRAVTIRFAVGVTLCEVGWVTRLALPAPLLGASFVVLGLAEVAVPVWAERAGPPTPWHAEHIAERYGLFTLIVLGESILAATTAIQEASSTSGVLGSVVMVAGGGLLIVFSLWWSYFDRPAHSGLRASRRSTRASLLPFAWGYGHYVVFACVAALGAGLQVVAERAAHAGEGVERLHDVPTALTVAVPVAGYLVVMGLLHTALDAADPALVVFGGGAVLMLAAATIAAVLPLPATVLVLGLAAAVVVAVDAYRRAGRGYDPAS